MIDGKLKKDMWKLAEADGWQEAGFYCLSKEQWEKVLDEAKQDFPLRHNMTVQDGTNVCRIRCFDCTEINAWRTKWFGSEVKNT